MRVLVVDDEPSIRSVISRALEDTMEVVETSDGPGALALLDEQPFDVVVLDVMLPDMDGFHVLDRIRAAEHIADTPVVLLTALVGEREHLRGYRAGADAYLTKPFDVDVLTAMVTEVAKRTPEARQAVRERELGRAELLNRIESQFSS